MNDAFPVFEHNWDRLFPEPLTLVQEGEVDSFNGAIFVWSSKGGVRNKFPYNKRDVAWSKREGAKKRIAVVLLQGSDANAYIFESWTLTSLKVFL